MTKNEIEKGLMELFKEAQKSKIEIAVASDGGGNRFNIIGSDNSCFYADSKDNFIVLGVDYRIEEDKLFNIEE